MELSEKGSARQLYCSQPIQGSLLLKSGNVLLWTFVPLHTPSNRESAWHLIHLERDLERDPDLELEELRERDLEDKKETEPFQYFPNMNHSSMTLWYSIDPNYLN